MNIILLGLRGSGKSTVGSLVAVRLGRVLIDLDRITLEVLGHSSVRQAWDEKGQQAFRLAETQALLHVLKSDDQIVALGGGTPTAPGALELLQEAQKSGRAELFYLAARAEVLRERLSGGGMIDRPSLTGGRGGAGDDPLAEIETVLSARDPMYRAIADYIVDAAQSPEQVAAEIIEVLPSH